MGERVAKGPFYCKEGHVIPSHWAGMCSLCLREKYGLHYGGMSNARLLAEFPGSVIWYYENGERRTPYEHLPLPQGLQCAECDGIAFNDYLCKSCREAT